jgi:hypothetical protein
MPQTPEELEEAKRQFLAENPPDSGLEWRAYTPPTHQADAAST